MLFLPESVYAAREHLWRDLENDTLTADTFQKMLELDPHDWMGMLGLGRLRKEAGDLEGAQEYFWRAIQAHPCVSPPYLELARLLAQDPETADLAEGLGELGMSITPDDIEAFLGNMDFKKAGFDRKAVKEFRKIPPAIQGKFLIQSLREKRDTESAATTERLRTLRLLQQVREDEALEAATVDAILAEGEAMVPLLVGVLRDWAQDLLDEDGDAAVENALALLGEIGSPKEIPHLLEFTDLEHPDASGAAVWALGRVIERHPEESAAFIRSIAGGFGTSERLAVAEQILRHPGFDAAGTLLDLLSEIPEAMDQEERDGFLPALIGTMAMARGRKGVEQGRRVLARQGGKLSRKVRRECDELLAAFIQPRTPPLTMRPTPYTVYDICAGDAVWDDDEDEEEVEDDVFVQEPIRRTATPGRNDPCWCGSGKKYKKCHLDADAAGNARTQSSSAADSFDGNEFTSLRKRIGEFLG